MGLTGVQQVWHSPHQYFLLIRHAAQIKSEDEIQRKCPKKRDKTLAKKHPERTKLQHFFKKISEPSPPPPQQSLSSWEVDFTAPITKTWLRLCDIKTPLKLLPVINLRRTPNLKHLQTTK